MYIHIIHMEEFDTAKRQTISGMLKHATVWGLHNGGASAVVFQLTSNYTTHVHIYLWNVL